MLMEGAFSKRLTFDAILFFAKVFETFAKVGKGLSSCFVVVEFTALCVGLFDAHGFVAAVGVQLVVEFDAAVHRLFVGGPVLRTYIETEKVGQKN